MFRKVLVGLLIALVLVTIGVWRMAPLTLSIGSGPIALVQNGVTTETVLSTGGGTGPVAAVLAAPSTAGTALVLLMVGSVQLIVEPDYPSGWIKLIGINGASSSFTVAIYPNNPGGILGTSIPIALAGGIGRWTTHISEWSGVAFTSPLETSGTAFTSIGTTLTPATSAAVLNSGDLAIAVWAQQIATNTATFTTPSGWSRLADSGALSRDTHLDAEYLQAPAVGQIVAPVLTSNRTTTDATGGVVVLKAAHPVVDMTAFLAY